MTGILHIVLARKPITGTVADNCLVYGTGALNIDACRIETIENQSRPRGSFPYSDDAWGNGRPNEVSKSHIAGRWPANLILEKNDSVVELFPETETHSIGKAERGVFLSRDTKNCYGGGQVRRYMRGDGDSGSASRFFFNFAEQESDE